MKSSKLLPITLKTQVYNQSLLMAGDYVIDTVHLLVDGLNTVDDIESVFVTGQLSALEPIFALNNQASKRSRTLKGRDIDDGNAIQLYPSGHRYLMKIYVTRLNGITYHIKHVVRYDLGVKLARICFDYLDPSKEDAEPETFLSMPMDKEEPLPYWVKINELYSRLGMGSIKNPDYPGGYVIQKLLTDPNVFELLMWLYKEIGKELPCPPPTVVSIQIPMTVESYFIPAWAVYIAMDAEGTWYAYSEEPVLGVKQWGSSGKEARITRVPEVTDLLDWEDSLLHVEHVLCRPLKSL